MKHFPGGEGDPTQIVVSQGKADAVIAAVSQVKGVSDVAYAIDPMTQNVKVVGGKVIINATLDQAPDSVEAGEYVTPIREAAKSADPTALVGGTSAVPTLMSVPQMIVTIRQLFQSSYLSSLSSLDFSFEAF